MAQRAASRDLEIEVGERAGWRLIFATTDFENHSSAAGCRRFEVTLL